MKRLPEKKYASGLVKMRQARGRHPLTESQKEKALRLLEERREKRSEIIARTKVGLDRHDKIIGVKRRRRTAPLKKTIEKPVKDETDDK